MPAKAPLWISTLRPHRSSDRVRTLISTFDAMKSFIICISDSGIVTTFPLNFIRNDTPTTLRIRVSCLAVILAKMYDLISGTSTHFFLSLHVCNSCMSGRYTS